MNKNKLITLALALGFAACGGTADLLDLPDAGAQDGGPVSGGETLTIDCDQVAEFTIDHGSSTTTYESFYASVTVPDRIRSGGITVHLCDREDFNSFQCPAGATCTGSQEPPRLDCIEGGYSLSASRLIAHCGNRNSGTIVQGTRWNTVHIILEDR